MRVAKQTKKETKKKVLTIEANDKLERLRKEERHNYQSTSWKLQTSNGFYNF